MMMQNPATKQLALVERWVAALSQIPAVDAIWLEGSLAADRANPASDIDLRLSIADAFYTDLWESDRTAVLAGLGDYLLLQNTFVRALTDEGIIVEAWAYRTSELLKGLELYEWKILFNRLPSAELPLTKTPPRTPAETWPEPEPLTADWVQQRMNFALLMMANAPSCFYTDELHAIMLTVNVARDDLLKLLWRRVGLFYSKRAKHMSEIFPAAWLTELNQTYPALSTGHLDKAPLAQALVAIFQLQGQHLQSLSDQATGGFEPIWYWRLHTQMREQLQQFM